MNRSKNFKKRQYSPDPVYGSVIIHRLICRIMKCGKKIMASNAVYKAIQKLESSLGKSGKNICEECIYKSAPGFTTRTKKVASSNYRIPVPIKPERGIAIALKWIKDAIRESSARKLEDKIYGELIGIYKDDKNSHTLKTKENLSKIAEKNKAFLHYL